MHKKLIKIPELLRDYIERLHYETIRYRDLLNSVNKDFMSQEEWDSSYEYFSLLQEEAELTKQFALEEIQSMYADEIQDQNWCVDFRNCQLVVGSIEPEPYNEEDVEQYNEYIGRLYPEDLNDNVINSNAVKSMTLQVTEACNMACTYCYQHSKCNNSMSFETAKSFIDMILDADERSNTYITSTKTKGGIIEFIGGEPWLEIDLITQVSDYFINELFRRKHNWAITFMLDICSNGLLHFEPKVQSYLQKHKYHLSYSISIDGDKDLHDSCRIDHEGNGTYDRAIAAVKDYRAMGGVIGSKMTISPNNVDKIYHALISMINNNYTNIFLNCVFEEGWTNKHANILYWQLHKITDWLIENNLQDKIKLSIFNESYGKPMDQNDIQNWCGGTGLMIGVNHKGDIYPCLRYMETSSNPNQDPFIIGTIKDGINQLPEHCNRVNCMSCITRKSQSTEECFNCPIASGCAWCSAYNYELYGTPNKRATFICCMQKARSLANVYYWRKKGINFPMHCPKEWAIDIIGEDEYNKLNAMEVG